MSDVAPKGEQNPLKADWRVGVPGLALATLLALLPFVGKAFHIDDPLFLWSARQCQATPWDFYGIEINWEGTREPMHRIVQNPPGMCWYLALAAACVGWSETALHLACLPPAIALVCGTWRLARRLCSRPDLAAAAVLAAPVFLVSSTTVMCDVLMVAFYIWSIEFWLGGLETSSAGRFVAAGCLIAAAGLTKYFGVTLIPLLVAYTILKRRKITAELVWLAIPVALLAIYQVGTDRRYGHGLLLDSIGYSLSRRAGFSRPWWLPALGTFCFCGGGLFPVLSLSWLATTRRMLAGLGVLAVLVGAVLLTDSGKHGLPVMEPDNPNRWIVAIQIGLFAAGGLLVLLLAGGDLKEKRDPDALLLALWIGGTFVFAAFLNWTISARILLPAAPAVAILLVRRLEAVGTFSKPGGSRNAWLAVGCSLIVAWAAAWGDYRLAGAARAAAALPFDRIVPGHGTVWFAGHWGFQYYMEQTGAKPLTKGETTVATGDVIVAPYRNADVFIPPAEIIDPKGNQTLPVSGWVTTMESFLGAGFYTDNFGPLPFAFGEVRPTDVYAVGQLRKSARVARDGTWTVEPPEAP